MGSTVRLVTLASSHYSAACSVSSSSLSSLPPSSQLPSCSCPLVLTPPVVLTFHSVDPPLLGLLLVLHRASLLPSRPTLLLRLLSLAELLSLPMAELLVPLVTSVPLVCADL